MLPVRSRLRRAVNAARGTMLLTRLSRRLNAVNDRHASMPAPTARKMLTIPRAVIALMVRKGAVQRPTLSALPHVHDIECHIQGQQDES